MVYQNCKILDPRDRGSCARTWLKKMGDFIETGTHRGTKLISKLKLKRCRKNQKCDFVIALNPKILYMRFLTAQLNRTLMKKS